MSYARRNITMHSGLFQIYRIYFKIFYLSNRVSHENGSLTMSDFLMSVIYSLVILDFSCTLKELISLNKMSSIHVAQFYFPQ